MFCVHDEGLGLWWWELWWWEGSGSCPQAPVLKTPESV